MTKLKEILETLDSSIANIVDKLEEFQSNEEEHGNADCTDYDTAQDYIDMIEEIRGFINA